MSDTPSREPCEVPPSAEEQAHEDEQSRREPFRMTAVRGFDEFEPEPQPPTFGQRLKFAGFSIVLALLLLLGLECWFRWRDDAELRSPLVPGEFVLVHQDDDELFYAPRPNLDVEWEGFHVTTNSLGLRGSEEVGPKQPGEFRILSLGESSTFGDQVEDEETYSFLLEEHLEQHDPSHPYQVLNAGVCAYTSFQSLKYLETKGLALKPDVILFYHEFSDYLPTANRESLVSDVEGIPLTDKQLYESKGQRWNRWLLTNSALYRYFSFRATANRLESTRKDRHAPGEVPIPYQLERVKTPDGLKRLKLPARVPPDDRRENLERLVEICKANDIQLVIIHPSYRQSEPHECDLTEFCREFDLPMFDAHESLHPDPEDDAKYFADLWHPNAEGHASMSQGLFEFLVAEGLVPEPDDGA